jgi:DNA-binding transcriptional ArsR family regulator
MSRRSPLAASALAALADPTRRELFERLRAGPQAVGELASGVTVSRPAVSQHLAVLKAAGLVKDTAAGTRRVYAIDPKGLGAIRAWLDDMWDGALASFAAAVDGETDTLPGKLDEQPTDPAGAGEAQRRSQS